SGLTVALSGLGGDELFAGYPSFRRINKLRLFCRVWNRLSRTSRYKFGDFLNFAMPPSARKEKIIEIFKEGSTLEHPYFWLRRLFTAEEVRRILNGYEFTGGKENPDLSSLDITNQVSYLEMTNYMRDILLRDTDFMSMAHSLEVRVPFLDHKLIEFVFSLPGRLKIKGATNKPLLTGSLSLPLPYAILKKRKTGFTLPFNSWLKNGLKDEVEEALREKEGALQELIDGREVLRIWDGFLKGQVSWQRPWAIYVLKRWVKTYL
ncbi:MAG TPA: asparagine synthase C-terminal domain-containing protein, partial [Candidatus Margulisiibacteriota bacterium]|nr:asparagine synthase C-terminal domain-containing protein [Candidatus Margulisiibacteriota bacterium]